jgi:hypothetical protein
MQPVHGPRSGVDEFVPSNELETVEVVLEKCEGFPEGTYGTADGVTGRRETSGESLVAFCFWYPGGGRMKDGGTEGDSDEPVGDDPTS